MIITINGVTIENNGKWSKAVVNYTTQDGKVETKNLMSFAKNGVYPVLSTAKQGETFEVQLGKNDKGYWEFTSATKTTGQGAQAPAGKATSPAGSPAPRSNFETPEERAARQVFIIRQSSLSTATSILSVGAKSVSPKQVIDTAKELEAYVFGKETVDHNIASIPSDEFFPEVQ